MRGVLKVRPHTKSVCVCGRGGGGQSTSGPIYEKWGGGGGGQSTSGSIYEKWGGGGQFASGPIRKVGGGGGWRYLCLAQRKFFTVNYKRLQF